MIVSPLDDNEECNERVRNIDPLEPLKESLVLYRKFLNEQPLGGADLNIIKGRLLSDRYFIEKFMRSKKISPTGMKLVEDIDRLQKIIKELGED